MLFHARVHSIVRGSPFVVALAVVAACSSSSSGSGSAGSPSLSQVPGVLEPDASMCPSPGGPVAGPDDQHCWNPDGTPIIQPTTAQGCYADAAPPGSGGDDGGGMTGDAAMATDGAATDAGGMTVDAGMPDIGNCGDNSYGATMYNDYGGDDDCKYNVQWTSSPICENQPVYFTVIVTHRTDGTALTGANPRPDVVLNCDHPVPNGPDGKPTARAQSPEVAPGTYVVGPVVFDKPGKWVFRFHFNEECLDNSPESPHGHAAFWVNVP
jgi:hypothetical protein